MSLAFESTVAAAGQRRTTQDVPRDRQVAYWLDLVCSLYVSIECDIPTGADLFGEVEFGHLGEIDVSHLRSNSPRVRHTQSHVGRDGDAYFLVVMLKQGRGAICQDGRMAVLGAMDLAVVDTTRPYELLFEQGAHDLVVLRIARRRLLAHVTNMEMLCATAISGQRGVGPLLAPMVAGLRPDVAALPVPTALAVSDSLMTLLGAALHALPDARGCRPSSMAQYHLARIRAYIEENVRDPCLSIGSIAAAMKISPDHLSRIFRGEPVPPSRLIWLRRLEGARRELADPRLADRGVSEIAFSWGYNDAAHFSRSFREQYGISPREWRCMHKAGAAESAATFP